MSIRFFHKMCKKLCGFVRDCVQGYNIFWGKGKNGKMGAGTGVVANYNTFLAKTY